MATKLIVNSGSWAGAWGTYWAGSWGIWGYAADGTPIEVYEWDTAQGVARNLARNLKFSAIQDTEVRLDGYGTGGGIVPVEVYASANVATGDYGAYSGAFATAGVISLQADSEVSLSSYGAASGVSECLHYCSALHICRGHGCESGHNDATSYGDAEFPTPSYGAASGSNYVFSYGVHNPTDEEAATIALLLVSKHLHSRKQYAIRRT